MKRHVLHGSGKIHRCLFGGSGVLKTWIGGEGLVFEKDTVEGW